MSEEVDREGESPPCLAPEAPADVTEASVELIVPAGAYGTIVTDDEFAFWHEVQEAEVPATPPESSRLLAAIEGLGDTVGRRLDALQAIFEREARAEATRERVVDRLHAELQEYKQDLLLKVLRPVFVDLIQLHDDIGKMVVAGAEGGPGDGRVGRLLEVMRGFQQGIEDILYRQGVEPFGAENDVFDPRSQRAVSTTPTDDPARNKTVAARLRKGFRAGDKVIRPEIVSVYALKK